VFFTFVLERAYFLFRVALSLVPKTRAKSVDHDYLFFYSWRLVVRFTYHPDQSHQNMGLYDIGFE
jgi:hypothetical protein